MTETETNHDRHQEHLPQSETAGMPKWVKGFIAVGLALVVLFVVLKLLGGNHGPGRHMPAGEPAGMSAPVDRSANGAEFSWSLVSRA